jgi:hypothetical protein
MVEKESEYKKYAKLFVGISKISESLGLLFECEAKFQINKGNTDMEDILNKFFDNKKLIIDKIVGK